MPVASTRLAPPSRSSLATSRAPLYGISLRTPSLPSDAACMLKPEKVAVGAPLGEALDGDALVMMHSDRTIDLNDQSSPLNSWSVTSKRLAFNASAVSLAAASPIALTVSEKVIDLGENTAPTCVRSIECSGSTLSENVGVNESIGVISTLSLSSSTYETASRVLQSMLSISRAPRPLRGG